MRYKVFLEVLTRFFNVSDNLHKLNLMAIPSTGRSYKPSTRKKGHFKKVLEKRRKRNKLARISRRKNRIRG